MFREFNVKFEDVEIIGGSDNLLEGTEVTKVILRGDSKMSSLDSALKNCSELDTIDGDLDLNGVNDIDNLLEGTPLVKEISVKNVNVEDMSCDNSFTNINTLNIAGDSKKKAIQNLLGNMDWEFDGVNYTGDMADVVTDKMEVLTDEECNIEVVDALEQKVRSLEIKGQTYKNLINGKEEKELVDNFITTVVDDNTSFEDTVERDLKIIEIQGNTLQNLIDGEDKVELIDDFRATVSGDNTSFDETYYTREVKISEIQGNTLQNLIEGKEEKRLTGEVKELTVNSNDSISTNLEEYEVLEFVGDTWQETEDSKNLFDINTLQMEGSNSTFGVINVKKKSITFTYENVRDYGCRTNFKFENGKSYKVSVDIEYDNTNSISRLVCIDVNGANSSFSQTYMSIGAKPNTSNRYFAITNVDIPSDGNEYVLYLNGNNYASGITGVTVFKNIVIEEVVAETNTDTATDYIPYYKADLSNIQSVGDLYTDEEGNPILDEEGNEQYVVKIRVSNSPFGKRGRL